jgi:hypothetical protein
MRFAGTNDCKPLKEKWMSYAVGKRKSKQGKKGTGIATVRCEYHIVIKTHLHA